MAEIELATREQVESKIPLTRATLSDGANADDIRDREQVGAYTIGSATTVAGMPTTGQAGVLNLVRGPSVASAIQTWATNNQFWFRKALNASSWGKWRQLISSEIAAGVAASEKILALARKDGWHAVYDPTNPLTTTVDSNGRITSIRDGLGNLDPLTVVSSATRGPRLLPGEYGQLDGIEAGEEPATFLLRTFGAPLPQPNTVMIFGHNTDPAPERRYLFDTNGGLSGNRHALLMRDRPENYYAMVAGGGTANFWGQGYGDTEQHLFTATFNGRDSDLRVDGQQYWYGGLASWTQALAGVRLGAYAGGGTDGLWKGSIGPILIYNGTPPAGAVRRMEALLLSLSGIQKAPAGLRPETIAYSKSSLGKETLVHGDPDFLLQSGIASMTKLMTVWVARQWLTDGELDDTVEILAGDIHSGPRLHPGDVISYRDLIYAAMLPSDNTSPAVLGRTVGEKIRASEGTTGTGLSRFREEMNLEAERLGYEGASFAGTVGDGIMSPRQIVDLFERIMADTQLLPTVTAHTHDITIVGGPDPRTFTVTHTILSSSNPPFPNFVAGKTGTYGGRGHIVAVWLHVDGSWHITVILNTDSSVSDQRYQELHRVMVATGM